ncbi:hypothetical protein AAFF_G00315850 [Aldrovandia affinis]|uniref:Uncharacterized protein n=1 Tax=Aldrovandia affinis TaxID=143900 RepID=A0AAD7SN00_9TELE|nr:hypothetical protein AAFF_G00315850 [Aldrovandia affinis]
MSRYLLQTCLGSFWQNAPTLDNYNTSIVPAALVAPTTVASASACSSVCFTPTALPSLAIRSCTCGIAPHASHLGHQGFLAIPSSRGPLGSGILQTRRQHGEYHRLVQELRLDDE